MKRTTALTFIAAAAAAPHLVAAQTLPALSGAAVTAGVVGGSYQVGKSSIVPLIIAEGKKIPIKTVGVSSPEDRYTLGLKAWMDKNGGKSATLKLLSLPQSEIEAAVTTKRIDAGNMCDAIPERFEAATMFATGL